MKIILFTFLFLAAVAHSQTYPIIGFGDYGQDGQNELAVKNLIYSHSAKNNNGQPLSWIITYGDNNYEYGSESTIDANVGKYYSQWIRYYRGSYRWLSNNGRLYSGSQDSNRFIWCLGNHDGYRMSNAPWMEYMSGAIDLRKISGKYSYYNVKYGEGIEFFILNSAFGTNTTLGRFNFEPDGIDSNSVQAQWLKQALSRSTATFKLIVMHHPPWSSVGAGYEDAYEILRWPFKRWGASAILCGHNHLYEFLILEQNAGTNEGLPVFVVGTGGGEEAPVNVVRYPGSRILIDMVYGAQFFTPYKDSLNSKFIDITGTIRHSYTIKAHGIIVDSLNSVSDSVRVLWKAVFLRQ